MRELTKDEKENLADFIELYLFDAIREDESIDNILWLCNMCSAYVKLKEGEGDADNSR